MSGTGWLRSGALAIAASLAACGASTPPDTSDGEPPVQEPPTEPGGAPLRFSGTAPTVDDIGPYGVSAAIDFRYDAVMATQNVDDDGLTADQYPEPVDVLGVIRYPLPTDDAPVPDEGFPVLLFQHGRHSSCSTTGDADGSESSGTDCEADGLVPIRSDLGYDYIAENLASHGYVVISINVNDINSQDSASNDRGITSRAELILHHLNIFRDINASATSAYATDTLGNDFSVLTGRMDFHHVGLMGHSRGGNGVAKTIIYNRDERFDDPTTAFDDPHDIVAVFALAPTDFNSELPTNTAFATLAPYCDGDVSTLHGTWQYDNVRYSDADSSGPQFQINALGANHNFYNDYWFNDDASFTLDAYCTAGLPTSGRFSRENQRRHGEFLIASFLRLFAGGETRFAGYWAARERLPDDACPDGTGPCDERLHLSMHRPDRLVVDSTLSDTSLATNDLGLSNTYAGFLQTGWCEPNGSADYTALFAGLVPDACPSIETMSKAPQVWGRWLGNPSITYALSDTGMDASGYDFFTLRVGVSVTPDNANGQDFTLTLTDADGVSASALASEYSDALYFPPGLALNARSTGAKTVMNMVPFRLDAQPWAESELDFSRLIEARIDFDQTTAGTVQITDVLFQQVD